MKKTKKTLIYILVVIIYFLIIPEIILRTLTSVQLARLSDFTSLGGIVNPLLSLLICFCIFAVVLAIITVSGVSKLLTGINNSEVR
jgi:small-conductance mechanosensitive channel